MRRIAQLLVVILIALLTASGAVAGARNDANGNMLIGPPPSTGMTGRTASYDGENRPASVVEGGLTTAYTYAADGTRLLRTDPAGKIVATFGPVEIRDIGGPSETVLTYPHPDLRLKNGTEVTWLHRDHLSSLRTMTNAAGARAAWQVYVPFGEQVQIGAPLDPEETKGFIGERYDSDAGLQYLNARYDDPKLAMFIQPDWFEVTKAGVGTNRYAYSGNDPVNKMDPGGNLFDEEVARTLARSATRTLFRGVVTVGTTTLALAAGMLVMMSTPAGNGERGGVRVSLTDEDRAAGYQHDQFGNVIDRNGNLVDPLSIPSQRNAGAVSVGPTGDLTTAAGNVVLNHGAEKGSGLDYITGHGHTPESIDSIIGSPTLSGSGTRNTRAGSQAHIYIRGADWVVVDSRTKEVVQVNDRNNRRQKPPEIEDYDEGRGPEDTVDD